MGGATIFSGAKSTGEFQSLEQAWRTKQISEMLEVLPCGNSRRYLLNPKLYAAKMMRLFNSAIKGRKTLMGQSPHSMM